MFELVESETPKKLPFKPGNAVELVIDGIVVWPPSRAGKPSKLDYPKVKENDSSAPSPGLP